MELFLIVLACCALMTPVVATVKQLEATILELNRGISASTNLYYSYSKGPLYEIALRGAPIHPPKLLLTEEASYEWGNYFKADVLAILFLEHRISGKQQQSLKRSMRKRWDIHMLLVLEAQIVASGAYGGSEVSVASVGSAGSAEREWLELFRWCWRNGFPNVLLLDVPTGVLLTYSPFPEVQLRRTTVAEYLQQPNKWSDFQGYPVRIAAANLPASFVCRSKFAGGAVSGPIAHILHYFTERRNATLLLIERSYYDKERSCLACASLLHDGEADVCDCLVAMEKNTSLNHTVIKPLKVFEFRLMVPYARPFPKYSLFGAPFTSALWLLVGLAVVYNGLALALISRRQSGEWHLGHSLLEAFRAMLSLGFRLPLRGGKLNGYLQCLLILCGFIIANLYLALLSSILTTDIYGPQINSYEDLHTNNISILYDKNLQHIYENRGIPDIVWQQMRPVPLPVLERLRHDLNYEYAYLDLKYPGDLDLHQQKYLLRPRLKYLKQGLYGELIGIPVWESSPFRQLFDAHLLYLFQSGILDVLPGRLHQAAIRCGLIRFFPTEYYEVQPLSLEFLIMPAMILAFGYAAANISFIVERFLPSLYGRRVAD